MRVMQITVDLIRRASPEQRYLAETNDGEGGKMSASGPDTWSAVRAVIEKHADALLKEEASEFITPPTYQMKVSRGKTP